MKKLIIVLALLVTQFVIGQNIQLLLSTEVNIEQIRDSVDVNENRLFNFQCVKVSEMIDGWLILVNEPDDFDAIELAIESIDDVNIIGSYYMSGEQYLWGNTTSRNHTLTKYTSKLKNKKTYDENGDILTDEPYTEIEALNKQVNLIAGWGIRILNN